MWHFQRTKNEWNWSRWRKKEIGKRGRNYLNIAFAISEQNILAHNSNKKCIVRCLFGRTTLILLAGNRKFHFRPFQTFCNFWNFSNISTFNDDSISPFLFPNQALYERWGALLGEKLGTLRRPSRLLVKPSFSHCKSGKRIHLFH